MFEDFGLEEQRTEQLVTLNWKS